MDRNSAANALGQKHEKNVDKKNEVLILIPVCICNYKR